MGTRRSVAAWRQPARQVRLARTLWVAWAFVVWNVVFDHVLVMAGRASIHAAGVASAGPGPYARIEDWMSPAIRSGLWLASAASLSVLAAGFFLIGFAATRHHAAHESVTRSVTDVRA